MEKFILKYAITSLENWKKYQSGWGDEELLNDVDILKLKTGDKIVIAEIGAEKIIEIK